MPAQVPTAPLSPRASLRWPFIRQAVTEFAPRRLLEAGCGQGAMGTRLIRLAPTYVAVEPDDDHSQWPRSAGTRGRADGARYGGRPARWRDLRYGVCFRGARAHRGRGRSVAAMAATAGARRAAGAVGACVPGHLRSFGCRGRAFPPLQPRRARGCAGSQRVPVGQARPVRLAARLRPGEGARPSHRAPTKVDRVRIAASEDGAAPDDMAQRTAASGRLLQPERGWLGSGLKVAVWPFTKVHGCGRVRATESSRWPTAWTDCPS